MKRGHLLLLGTGLLLVAGILADVLYVRQLKSEFVALEEERVQTSNGLATAKIVHENLNHVRDLVFENMDFQGRKDTVDDEAHVFNFITACVNDLKLELLSLKPLHPQTSGRVTRQGYDLVIAGDFFKFGELCSKFENSRRIISLESYSVDLQKQTETARGGAQHKGISVRMRINTYRVRK